MFLEKSFSQRCVEPSVRGKGVVIFLIAMFAFLFIGCPLDDNQREDTGFIPVGEWSDDFGGGYNITETSIEYYTEGWGEDFPAENLKGSIERAVDFSYNSGVIILKITVSENTNLTVGKYTGVYYKDYTSSHALLANPLDDSFAYIETDSLNAALSLFTSGNASTHVSFWGTGYTK